MNQLLTIELTKKGKDIFCDLIENPNTNNSEGWKNLFKEFGKQAEKEIREVYFQ